MPIYLFEVKYVIGGVFYEAVERPTLKLAEKELEWRHTASSATYSLHEVFSLKEYAARLEQAKLYGQQLLIDLEAGETNLVHDKLQKMRAAGYGSMLNQDTHSLHLYPTLDTTFKGSGT